MKRRHWLATAAGAAAVAAQPAREAAAVRVAGLDLFAVKVNRRGNWMIARLATNAGLRGLGDASHGGDAAVVELIRLFHGRLRDRGVFELEWLREAAQPEIGARGRPAAVALSALEQCLYDIQGQALGVPCWALFGGKLRDRLRNYANINRSTEARDPSGFARNAEAAVKAGFDAIKLASFDGMPRGDEAKIGAHTQLGIDCIAAVRQAIGAGRGLLVDVHSNLNLERGLDLARRLEKYDLFWLEEMTPGVRNLAEINRQAKMPTAGGESIYGVKGFYPYIAGGAVDIVMPDVKYCGGMLELKKIAAMAEGAGLLCSPHGPASPVGNLAAAQVCATLANFQILEYSFGEVGWRAELIDPPEQVRNGYLALTDRPGFGIRLNEKIAAKYAV